MHSSSVDGEKKVWTQAFSVGYIKTAFTRACVSSANLYTAESAPYRLRQDARLLSIGRAGKRRDEPKPPPMRNVRARMEREME